MYLVFLCRHVVAGEKETGRIFWNAFGEVLEAVSFLPITVNVPDVVSGVWGFFTGFLPGGQSEGTNNPRDPVVDTAAPNKTNEGLRFTFDDVIDYVLFD